MQRWQSTRTTSPSAIANLGLANKGYILIVTAKLPLVRRVEPMDYARVELK